MHKQDTALFHLQNIRALARIRIEVFRLSPFGMIETKYLAILNNDGNQIITSFSEDAQFLLLTGLPIDEKITQSGPFVMNTQTQILEAM